MSDGGAVVLIVEDDEAARVAIAGNLRARGHEVDEAGDVREALRLWDCPTWTARPSSFGSGARPRHRSSSSRRAAAKKTAWPLSTPGPTTT